MLRLAPIDEERIRNEMLESLGDELEMEEAMIEHTHIAEAPWWIVEAVDKKRARLNCIHHLLSLIPYQEMQHPHVTLPERVHNPEYLRGPIPKELYVPSVY